MPWVKLDDHFDEHPKLASVGPLGVVLWVTALAYCNRNLTDGFIPWSIARTMVSWDWEDAVGPTRLYIGALDSVYEEGAVTSEYAIESLVASGLWDRAPGGYRVHDFNEYQPTKAEVEAERAAKVAAGRAGGQASAQARARAQRQAPAQAQSKPVPVPVPVPDDSKESSSRGGAFEANDGIFDAYYRLTAKTPSSGATTWLNRLADENDEGSLLAALTAEHKADPDTSTLLGRVQTRLADKARRDAKASEDRRKTSAVEEIEALRDAMPQEQRQANTARLGAMLREKGLLA